MEISRTPLSQLLALLAVTIVPLLNTNASESVFKHSDVALMPEWEPDDLRVQHVLSPTVIAWGKIRSSTRMSNCSRRARFTGIWGYA